MASVACWVYDFSLLSAHTEVSVTRARTASRSRTWGCMEDAMESYVPLMESLSCSVNDFWESGYTMA